jgi:DNA polymerase III subunit alpha, Gram-positive type
MDKTMIRFLTSIGLGEEAGAFDIGFKKVYRNPKRNEQVIMEIIKETPWDYPSLLKFQAALLTINYPYEIVFSYEKGIDSNDGIGLFKDWYLDHVYSDPAFEIKQGNDSAHLECVFSSLEQKESEAKNLREFGAFLVWLNYPLSLSSSVKKSAKEELTLEAEARLDKNESEEEISEPAPELSEEISEEESLAALSNDEIQERIQMEFAKNQERGEELLMAEMIENQKAMEAERNRKRVFTTGDYRVLEHLGEIESAGLVNVDVTGEVFQIDSRTTKTGKKMFSFGLGDSTGAISVRAFDGKRLSLENLLKIKDGMNARIRGAIDIDRHGQKELMAHYIDILPPKPLRDDQEEEKRVELHLHTKMSTMDGLGEMSDYYALAKHMGMKAIAVTDHGAVQGFPAAQAAHDADAKRIKKNGLDEKPLKIIYGAELYMFDLKQKYIFNPCETPLRDARYCVFDTETTGLSSRYDRIIEFGGVLIEKGQVIKRFDTFVKPDISLANAQEAMAINHISESDLRGAPTIEEVLPSIMDFLGDNILVAHNATFDIGMLNAALKRNKEAHPDSPLPDHIANPVIDTLPLSHYLFPLAGAHNEKALLRNLGLDVYDSKQAHRADYDAECLNDGWLEIVLRLEKAFPGIRHCDLADLKIENGNENDPDLDSPDASIKEAAEAKYKKDCETFNNYCRHFRSSHCVVLVKNTQGLQDLYRIITQGETTYLERASVPKTPRELIEKYRENFMVGSACFNGEVFETALTRSKEELVETIRFYDYIELQPIENYSYLINMGELHSHEDLIRTLKDIVEAAKIAGVKVVATGDCHYVNPEDKIYRDVYIYAKGVGNGAHPLNPPRRERKPFFENPDQHFRSTREMLDSFMSWLPESEAREYVIANSNWVADQIRDDIVPMLSGTYTPNENLPHSDKILRDLCESNFHERYDYLGNDDDPEVKAAIDFAWERLQKELTGIISNGYAVTYYIAHLLIKDVENAPKHFIVGSRGSVGSSFAATTADITEVNPLPPHWQCPHCHYLEFSNDPEVKSGFDLPDKVCPKCGSKLLANGQNIPFETFLGFNANKVPDIDLNFEDEAQHLAHQMTKVHLGAKQVYRAGTIETVADKTAFGYVRGYFEKIGRDLSQIDSKFIAYLAGKCTGVKRTTGQHPGGIVVVPKERSIYEFTAVQHPADDLNSEWLTTHYDYHSMHDELLKFDILGHVDPMAMRYYRDLTGVKIREIPMNDKRVLSLFNSPNELHLQRNYMRQKTGALAIPEFGTGLAQRMLEEAQPKTFNDLLIMSGLSHGTDVWAGNAEDLILNGVTDLHGVIGCRDDIMTYMISCGIEKERAFKIMEDVRHGKGLTQEFEDDMRAHNVPDFYIDSAKKIKYLFPRGHATAYVMMAVRVAYFKLYHPLEFYSVFFSVRSDAWDLKVMLAGEEALVEQIKNFTERQNDRNNPLSPKEKNILKTDLVALEMYERGYKVSNIDLYKSDAKLWVADHEHNALIPSFNVVDGLGEAAALSVVEARKNGKEFLSKEDLLSRTKLNGTNVKDLDDLGVLKGMGETNQMSLFEFF